ncbi:MAG: thioredoxin [Bacteroidales bacterium]
MAVQFTDANFKEQALESSKPVLVDFWAEWCGPCRVVAPVVEELSTELGDDFVIGKMDVDSNNEVPAQYGVRNIPTILFIKDGKVVDKHVGVATKNQLLAKLEALK